MHAMSQPSSVRLDIQLIHAGADCTELLVLRDADGRLHVPAAATRLADDPVVRVRIRRTDRDGATAMELCGYTWSCLQGSDGLIGCLSDICDGADATVASMRNRFPPPLNPLPSLLPFTSMMTAYEQSARAAFSSTSNDCVLMQPGVNSQPYLGLLWNPQTDTTVACIRSFATGFAPARDCLGALGDWYAVRPLRPSFSGDANVWPVRENESHEASFADRAVVALARDTYAALMELDPVQYAQLRRAGDELVRFAAADRYDLMDRLAHVAQLLTQTAQGGDRCSMHLQSLSDKISHELLDGPAAVEQASLCSAVPR